MDKTDSKEEKKKLRFLSIGKSKGKLMKSGDKINLPHMRTSNTRSSTMDLKSSEKFSQMKWDKKYEGDFKSLIQLKDQELIRLGEELKRYKNKENNDQEGEINEVSPNLSDLREKLKISELKLYKSEQDKINLKNDKRIVNQSLEHEKERRLLSELKESKTAERAQELLMVLEHSKREVTKLFSMITSMIPAGQEKTSILEKYEVLEEYMSKSIENFIDFQENNTEDNFSENSTATYSMKSPRSMGLRNSANMMRKVERSRPQSVSVQSLTASPLSGNESITSSEDMLPKLIKNRQNEVIENNIIKKNTNERSTTPLDEKGNRKSRVSPLISSIRKRSNSVELFDSPQVSRRLPKNVLVSTVSSLNFEDLNLSKRFPPSFSSENLKDLAKETPVKLSEFGGVKVKSKIKQNVTKNHILRGLNEFGFDFNLFKESLINYSNSLTETLKSKDEKGKIEKITSELINTEKDYVSDLKVIIDVKLSFVFFYFYLFFIYFYLFLFIFIFSLFLFSIDFTFLFFLIYFLISIYKRYIIILSRKQIFCEKKT